MCRTISSEQTERELTLGQQGLWFLLQAGDLQQRAAYNTVFAFRVEGALDLKRLGRALNAVIERHEALRSRLVPRDGLAIQLIDPVKTTLHQNLHEATGDPASVASWESAQPIDVSASVPWRVTLVRATAGGPVTAIVLVCSHALFDEGSANVFFRDLTTAYVACCHGTMSFDLATPQLKAVAEVERTYLAGAAGREALQKIAGRLDGMPLHLRLPRSRPASAPKEVYDLAGIQLSLTPGETARIAQAAGKYRVSTAAWHLAAFQVLLWRYTGQGEFGVCLPVSTREALKVQDEIGYFTNLAVVRARINGTLRVEVLLAAVMDGLVDVLDAAMVPYPAVIKRLRRAGKPLQEAYLQLGFGHLRTSDAPLDFGDTRWLPIAVLPRYAKNEIKLDVRETPSGTRFWLLYDNNGFDRPLIEQMAADYRRLVLGMVLRPEARLRELPLLDEQMRLRLLVSWSGAAVPWETDAPWVHRWIEEQAVRAPRAVAVVSEAGELRYDELNARANRLGRRLRALGVRPDVLVGVCAEGGAELVTAVLAVLKAGGAYMPLDPQYPAARLAYMVQDAAASMVLAAPGCTQKLPATVRVVEICAAADAAYDDTDLDTRVRGENLAYCIYTSGSTGQPKGAANTHRGFANLVRWYMHECLDGVGVRVLLASSPSFDMTQKSLLGTLAAGGTLVVPAGGTGDVDALREALCRHAPTVICCAPSAYRAYVDDPGTLRTVVLGGEVLDAALAAQVRAYRIRLVNSYGPTECADIAVRHVVGDGEAEVPLGRPLPQVRVYVLDAYCQLVPVGAVGELHIAGLGVARGYVSRPELTAEKFIPDPFGPPGSRMYRTGDLGRFRGDGLLEFVGRADHQVKVRGFRIELGEVENALLQCTGVREAAVLAPVDAQGQRWLVAYLSAAEGVAMDVANLRQALAHTLPIHMVPTSWHVLPALPLSGSGKIDRLALTQLQAAPLPAVTSYEPPADATEALLAALWADVLHVERVGRYDDFFVLGGHSLTATKVVARVNDRLGVRVSVRHLFDAPTIAAFAQFLDSLSGTPAVSVDVPPAIVSRSRRSLTQPADQPATRPLPTTTG
jgi:amino acid adenylation domain-containing protein